MAVQNEPSSTVDISATETLQYIFMLGVLPSSVCATCLTIVQQNFSALAPLYVRLSYITRAIAKFVTKEKNFALVHLKLQHAHWDRPHILYS